MRLLGFKLELWKTDHDVAQCQSVRMRSNVTDGIALRQTQTITQIQAQAQFPASVPQHLRAFSGTFRSPGSVPSPWRCGSTLACGHLIDKMVAPSHLFDHGRATYVMKYVTDH